jgi:Ni,Fe-hydrogenase III large subunit
MHDCTIPIGPQHPALKEPMCLRITLDGNYIQNVNVRMGYAHKGLEKILEGKNPDSALYLSQRICGICSAAHENAYTRTVEGILKHDVPERVKLLRAMMIELERMHSHILWAGFMAQEIGYETLFMLFWRERERVISIFERISGGRVHHAYNKIKTVRYDINETDINFILRNIGKVRSNIRNFLQEIKFTHIIKMRLGNVGTIKTKDALNYGLVGQIARASNVKNDIRKIDPPYGIYKKLKFEQQLETKGDAYSRVMVRINEIFQSVDIIRQALEKLDDTKIPKPMLSNVNGEGIGRVEAPRGELFYYLNFKDNKIQRAKIRTPTFAVWKIIEKLLIGGEVGDVPVIIGSLDPCFSCLERVLVEKKGKVKSYNEKQFRRNFVCTE